MVDLEKVGAHYAVSSLFEEYGQNTRIYCYDMERMEYRSSRQGKLRVVLGQASVTSEITWESDQITFGVLHLADHSVIGGVRQFHGGRGISRTRPGSREGGGEWRSGGIGTTDGEELRLGHCTRCDCYSAMNSEKYSTLFWRKRPTRPGLCTGISTTNMPT